MLQTYMFGIPDTAKRINDTIAMDSKTDEVIFLSATGPFYSFKKNDKVGKRLAQGIIISQGLANTVEVSKALQINQSTVSRNAKIYRDKGAAGFIDDRSNRSAYRLTKDKQRIVKNLLDGGSTIVAAAAKVGVSEGSIRYALKKDIIQRKSFETQDELSSVAPKGVAVRSQEDTRSLSGIAVKRETDRVMASRGALEEAPPEFSSNEGVHYAGALLALPFLSSIHYIEACKTVYGSLKKGYYGLQSIFLTLAFMALLRIKNPEQLKNGKPGELGIILGLDRSPETKTMRRKLNELGLRLKSADLLAELSQAWVKQDKDILGFCYIDGHVRPYHGRKHILPKTHVARRRLCMPATTDFWVNDASCEPVFFVTTEANNSLLSTVEKQIIPELRQLSGGDRVTIVFDREGWSPKQFSKWCKSGIDIITYRKGAYKPWSKDCFVTVSSEIRGKSVSYKLSERSIQIGKHGWFREVRRLCDNDHQTSIITTRQDLSMEEIARRMFFRWNQENYFKYMREEYGLDHLISRDVEPSDTERLVPNPQKKELKKERTRILKKLKKQKEHYATKAVENDEGRCRTMRGFNISNFGLKSAIQKTEAAISNLELKIKALPDKVAIKEILDKSQIVRLETEKKRLTDTIKMACYRTETVMLNFIVQSKKHPWSTDEGRRFMKAVFQQQADLLPDYENGRMEIRFHTMSTWRDNKGLGRICRIANESNYVYPGTDLKMVFVAPENAFEIT